MKKIGALFFLLLASCSNNSEPKRFFLQSVDMPSLEAQKIQDSVSLLNAFGNTIDSHGDRPVLVKNVSLDGTIMARAVPRAYGCVIEIDTANSVISQDPDIIKYIFAHELGHCYGLGYSNDPDDIMYFSLVTSWSVTLEDKIKNQGTRLRGIQ